MKIVVPVTHIEDIKDFKEYADCFLLRANRLSALYSDDLNLDDALLECDKYNIQPIISIDKIMHPKDIEIVKHFLNRYKDTNALFYVADLGVVNLAKNLGIVDRVIYDPKTMITNHYDYSIYMSLGIDAAGVSNEIPLKQLIEIYTNTKGNIYYQVFGHRLMFYSRRQVVSLYSEHSSKSFNRDNLTIKEMNREDRFPILENDNGTFVYRSYQLSLLEELSNLSFLKYVFFETMFLDKNTVFSVLKAYKSLINGEISLETAKEEMDKLSLNIQDGFNYKDTAYIKGEESNE